MSKKPKVRTILVTGGAGYIGTHTIVELLSEGYRVVVLDNFSNSSAKSLSEVEKISGKTVRLIEGDVRNISQLMSIFDDYSFDGVIHFAGLKAVGESVINPLRYYDYNVAGTLNLLKVMSEHDVKNLVFSSSATVYGDPVILPLKESHSSTDPTNPYGMSKLMVENILKDLTSSDPDWNIVTLRYFNPVGAHKSGFIGENPNGVPNNLMPFVSQTALGRMEFVSIYGDDYDTPDGTGVRDYIHVMDLALGHVKALEKVHTDCGLITVNLGTGRGYSVLEIINTFEKVSGRKINYKFVGRRPGDVAACIACPFLAKKLLNWEAKYDLVAMCEDTWRWQSHNANGYI